MDLSTLLGWIVGIGLIIFSIVLNQDSASGAYSIGMSSLKAFYDLPSIAIVIGGTFCALMVSYPLSILAKLPKHLGIVIKNKTPDPNESINQIVEFAKEARINGVLALEEKVKGINDTFMKNALMMVCDSVDPEKVQEMMDNELGYLEERHTQAMNFYLKGSDYAPAFGMVGTLIGLIKLLGNLSDSDALAGNMAVALITTLYGTLLSNFFFKPVANKLKIRHEAEMLNKNIIVVGIQGILAGDNPNFINEKLVKLLPSGGSGKKGKDGKKFKDDGRI